MFPPFARAPFALVAPKLDELPPKFLCLLVDGDKVEEAPEQTGTHPTNIKQLLASGESDFIVFPIDLAAKEFTIGRSSKNNVVINDHRVSRSHASMAVGYARTYWLIDAGSSNGTVFQDKHVKKGEANRVLVTVGSTFLLGGLPVTLLDKGQLRDVASRAVSKSRTP